MYRRPMFVFDHDEFSTQSVFRRKRATQHRTRICFMRMQVRRKRIGSPLTGGGSWLAEAPACEQTAAQALFTAREHLDCGACSKLQLNIQTGCFSFCKTKMNPHWIHFYIYFDDFLQMPHAASNRTRAVSANGSLSIMTAMTFPTNATKATRFP